MNYQVGGLLQIVGRPFNYGYPGWDRNPSPIPDDHVSRWKISLPPDHVWIDVFVKEVSWAFITVGLAEDSNCVWNVLLSEADWILRPRSHSKTSQAELASNCLECRIGFMYPLAHTHQGGALCYSCNSTYGWKYNETKV